MENQFSRTELLIGEGMTERLRTKRVAVFGVGGVGGYAVEVLARAGIGTLDLIDADTVSETNINRQILALHSTVGMAKADVAAARVRDICPSTETHAHKIFYTPETANLFDFHDYDYVIDAIDTVSGKIELVLRAKEAGVPIISAMGAGNKFDASAFEVADIAKTTVCPLARVMRIELRKRGVNHLKVVYSREAPKKPLAAVEDSNRRATPGSMPFVPPVAGCLLAGEVIKDLLGGETV